MCVSHSVVSDSLLIRLLCPWGFSRQEYWSGCLLQGIFLTQGSNLHLLHCRQILCCPKPPNSLSVQVSCSVMSNSCNRMDCSTPGFPVHHQLPEPTQTHLHPVSDAIQLFHPLSSPSPPALNLSQHQSLFQGVSSLH